jgi:endonuclease-3
MPSPKSGARRRRSTGRRRRAGRPPVKLGTRAEVRARALLAVERLARAYPHATTALVHEGPFQLLIATILSAQTTDERVNQVTPILFASYPTPEALANADPADVERTIQPTGFFRAKTKSIVGAARALVEHHGGQVPPRMEDLVTLPGVGRKTANVVLGVAFGIPGFAVDTHVKRLVRRLGLTRQTDPVKIETEICAMVPPEEWTRFGLRLILHGRQVCFARKPDCPACVMNDFCPSSTAPPPAASAAGLAPLP